ncbi:MULTISPECIES: hypothetical protein [unclassified Niallia]|uniref:hypothetical protein n=1 Tax=unclassified Niallia TaxID=2837522 RepID=UPI001EDC1E41|nr:MULTISPECIES: hypothetical protein [unclassified Niallia]MDL0434424.1 hypothetical protein [Niallia sp. SS-2023]UPO89165.1 hypothetical protein L8T27_008475 [Niallia sp. Man26]
MKFFLVISLVFTLSSCIQLEKPVTDIRKFSLEKNNGYLLFHFHTPFTQDGYIKQIDLNGNEIQKYNIEDSLFAPSDVFKFDNNFYFASGAYSNDNKVINYNPQTKKMSLIETKQKKYIEKYFKKSNSEYIITILDSNNQNEYCDITLKKCNYLSEAFRTHDITVLENYVIAVGINKSAINDQKGILQIKKMDSNFKPLEEIHLDNMPNYFTYTSPDEKLYLFMFNGDIVSIDSDLNIKKFPFYSFAPFSGNPKIITYNKNVSIDNNTILINFKLNDEDKSYLAKLNFDKATPTMQIISSNTDEQILNVDDSKPEVYTRSYVNDKTIITVRDITTLKVIKTILLESDDPIYFVDNIE